MTVGRSGDLGSIAARGSRGLKIYVGADPRPLTACMKEELVPLWFGWALKIGPQRRPFSAVPRRLPQQPDSVAERGGFELSGDLLAVSKPSQHVS
jgi:hypothetical protein